MSLTMKHCPRCGMPFAGFTADLICKACLKIEQKSTALRSGPDVAPWSDETEAEK